MPLVVDAAPFEKRWCVLGTTVGFPVPGRGSGSGSGSGSWSGSGSGSGSESQGLPEAGAAHRVLFALALADAAVAQQQHVTRVLHDEEGKRACTAKTRWSQRRGGGVGESGQAPERRWWPLLSTQATIAQPSGARGSPEHASGPLERWAATHTGCRGPGVLSVSPHHTLGCARRARRAHLTGRVAVAE